MSVFTLDCFLSLHMIGLKEAKITASKICRPKRSKGFKLFNDLLNNELWLFFNYFEQVL